MPCTGCHLRLVCLAFVTSILVSFEVSRVSGVSMSPLESPKKTAKERFLWSDISSMCTNSNDNEPKIYYVSQLSAKCVSLDPVRWDISFFGISDLKLQLRTLPYTVKLEWKSCGSTSQSQWKVPDDKIYYDSIVEFNQSKIGANVESIGIRCSSNTNGTRMSITWLTVVSKDWNLSEGNEDEYVINDVRKPPCLCDSFTLGSDINRSKITCLKEGRGPSFSSSSIRPLECHDWISCQQLGAIKIQNACLGKWGPGFCDLNPGSCASRDELMRNISGIIICRDSSVTPHQAFYFPFFQAHLNSSRTKANHIVSDPDKDFEELVTLGTTEMINNKTEGCVFKCSAPKFLALAGFQWSAICTQTANWNTPGDCNITRNDMDESYVEELICNTPLGLPSCELAVWCTVFLQSGHVQIVNKNASQKCSFASAVASVSTPLGLSGIKDTIIYTIIVIAVCFLATIPVLVVGYCKIRRQKKQIEFSAEEIKTFREGTAGLRELSSKKAQPAAVLPYDINLEVPRNQIILEPKLLGEGAFGRVIKGRIGDRPVAIKTTKKNVDGQYFRALLSELKIMTFVGKHTNLVELVGANTERIRKQEVYLMFEYCEDGNVLEYIRSRRDIFVGHCNKDEKGNAESPGQSEDGVNTGLCSEDLIRWSVEVATGMEFISSKNVYHGDLAARNILLTRNLVAKVRDFGLARELKDYTLYVQQAECPLPLKWMSIESLRDLEFSIQSDVWSFGITLWEIFSLGSTPYPDVEWNFQAWKRLRDGERMDRPSHATESIHDILMMCWEAEPNDRPNFAELKQALCCEMEKLKLRNL